MDWETQRNLLILNVAKILLLVVITSLWINLTDAEVLVPQETSTSFSMPKAMQSSSSSIILTAYSVARDEHGVEHNITWHTTVPVGLNLHRQIADSVPCLHGVTAQWVNLTVSPVILSEKTDPPSDVTTKTPFVRLEKSLHKALTNSNLSRNESLLDVDSNNTKIYYNISDGSHCDTWDDVTSVDSLSRPLTSNGTSDPDGIKFTELDAHKIERVANFTVRKHNCLRTIVSPSAGNMLKMEWSREAADLAQDWADQCSYNHNNETNRTTSLFPCGQNIAYTTPWPFSWNSVVNMWFNEYAEYKFGEPNDLHTVGHYTAMTWATTYQLGCAYKDCGGWHFYVCHYCPNGNYGDLSAPYKGGQPCEACPNSCDRGLCTNSCNHTNFYSNCDELERKYKICSSKFQERLAVNCKATCLCSGNIYL